MSTLAAVIATIAGVAIVFQLTKNVASSGQAPTTGLKTATGGLTSITSTLFSK